MLICSVWSSQQSCFNCLVGKSLWWPPKAAQNILVSSSIPTILCVFLCVFVQELKKKLEKLGLKPVKIKKPLHIQQKVPYCFVTFRSEEEREVRDVTPPITGCSLTLTLIRRRWKCWRGRHGRRKPSQPRWQPLLSILSTDWRREREGVSVDICYIRTSQLS